MHFHSKLRRARNARLLPQHAWAQRPKQAQAPPPQVPATLAPRVHDCYHLPDVRGSDHCPIGIVLKGPPDDWAHALPVGAPTTSMATAASPSAAAVAAPPAGDVPVA